MRLFEDDKYWVKVNDGNELALSIFKRHYSYRHWRHRKGKNGNRIVGPGEQIILVGKDGRSLFIWRKEIHRNDGQTGINCAVFRNESGLIASGILQEAEEIAWNRWPAERLFTFVDPKKIKSSNPGYCFKMNGWRQIGITKAKKLVILEKLNSETTDERGVTSKAT